MGWPIRCRPRGLGFPRACGASRGWRAARPGLHLLMTPPPAALLPREIHMPCTIRPEQPPDRTAIHALTQAAFLHAPHAAHTEHFIVDALRAAGALHLSLVAEEEGGLVRQIGKAQV